MTYPKTRGTLSALKIRLNGDAVEVQGPLTVAQLLTTFEIDARLVAVEHNLVILKRKAYESTLVDDGDQVEVVNAVAGG